MGFVIAGDTENYKDCLVRVLYAGNREQAEQMFQRFMNSTDNYDIKLKNKFTNIRVECTDPANEWWNDKTD